MKKGLLAILIIFSILYIIVCCLLYFFQEKLIFFPEKLDQDFKFNFDQKFEEISLKSKDNVLLNGLLFKADSSKGVIFYFIDPVSMCGQEGISDGVGMRKGELQ